MGSQGTEPSPVDPDLAAIIQAWPRLPEATKAKVMAIILDTTTETRRKGPGLG
jgi:hypothetical protein